MLQTTVYIVYYYDPNTARVTHHDCQRTLYENKCIKISLLKRFNQMTVYKMLPTTMYKEYVYNVIKHVHEKKRKLKTK